MAIYHLSVKAISRSSGRSTVAAAAYRAGVRLDDKRQGLVHDYTRKGGVISSFLVTPPGAIWAQDRDALWNAAEAAEKRKDAKVGREYEIALPAELNGSERERLAHAFARAVVERYGVAADVALHEPGREGDERNYHAHILTTTRVVNADGLGAKTRLLDVSSSAKVEVEQLRELWAKLVNDAFDLHQIDQRVDHRSFRRQERVAVPTIHMGPAATAMERRAARRHPDQGPVTDIGKWNAATHEKNRLLETARQVVEKAREAVSRIEKRARLAVGLARRIGQRSARERQAEQVQLEHHRQRQIEERQERETVPRPDARHEENSQTDPPPPGGGGMKP